MINKTEVLVVGAGPVGLLTGLLLEKLGIDYRIIERRPDLHTAPQAHVISSRSLEICRSVGIDDALIRSAGPSPMDTSSIRWVDRLAGRDLGVFHLDRDQPSIHRMLTESPTPICNLSQDQFERILFDHLPGSGRVLFDHAWESLSSTDDGYLSRVRGPDGGLTELRSQFVVGADGASSRVRKAMGAEMAGPENLQTYVTIHFSADLRERLNGREGLLYWVVEDSCEGIFIAHDIDGNWIFMKSVGEDEPLDPIDEEKFASLLQAAVGAEVALQVHSMQSWRMSAQISSSYQQGGVFLVGDAAHRFPPTGGIGMNTGFQDAHNLVWKIGMARAGYSAVLLDSYEIERKPAAEANSAQSVANARKMTEVTDLLDVDADGHVSMLDIDATFDDPDRMADVQAAVDRQGAHFNMSGLDLGICYHSNAVIEDGAPPQSNDPVSVYLPSTTPGGRLPHAWLSRDGESCSTLDLVRYDSFLVLAAGPGVGGLESAVSALVANGYPLHLECVGSGESCQPADDSFNTLFTQSEVLLVRPDGHIAARLPADLAVSHLAENIMALLPRG